MTHLRKILAIATLAVAVAFTGSALAGPSCNTIERLGNNPGLNTLILGKINASVAGTKYKIRRRKKLKIKSAYNLHFEGCRAFLSLKVTLKRRIRRNAHGHVVLRADTQLDDGKVCISHARVKGIHVSHTTRLGEKVYRWVANKAMPGSMCVAF